MREGWEGVNGGDGGEQESTRERDGAYRYYGHVLPGSSGAAKVSCQRPENVTKAIRRAIA